MQQSAKLDLPQLTATNIPAPLKPLSPKYRRAAQHVAEDVLSDERIAKECGVNRATLVRWKEKPFFIAAVVQIRETFSQQMQTEGLARVEVRIREKRDRHQAIKQELAIRAQIFKGKATGNGVSNGNPTEGAKVKGGKEDASEDAGEVLGETGYVVRKLKMIGTGPAAKEVEEFEIDTRSSQELSRLEEEIAVELGQRVEKHEIEARILQVVVTRSVVGQQPSPSLAAKEPEPHAGA